MSHKAGFGDYRESRHFDTVLKLWKVLKIREVQHWISQSLWKTGCHLYCDFVLYTYQLLSVSPLIPSVILAIRLNVSTGNENTQRTDVRVDQGKVERREVKIRVRDRHKYRLVDRRIALIDFIRRLPAPTLVGPCDLEGRVRGVDLRDPGQELGLAGRC